MHEGKEKYIHGFVGKPEGKCQLVRIILKLLKDWTGLIGHRIGTSGGLL
jgi:hypothetical protein